MHALALFLVAGPRASAKNIQVQVPDTFVKKGKVRSDQLYARGKIKLHTVQCWQSLDQTLQLGAVWALVASSVTGTAKISQTLCRGRLTLCSRGVL